jgi:hypothetical protein
MNRPPNNFSLAIVGCFYPPTTETATTGVPPTTGTTPTTSTGTPVPTTTTLQPTTTTMNYCTEEKGMNAPLIIQPNQTTFSPSPDQTTPTGGNINPTTTSPGLNFPTNPQINVTFDQPATLTVVYIPVDRPNEPSNVNTFTIVFVYPNGTSSPPLNSQIPLSGASTTTTPSSGAASEATTTPATGGIVPPSNVSPQVDLPPIFRIPEGTTIVITITSTINQLPPTGVCILFCLYNCALAENIR